MNDWQEELSDILGVAMALGGVILTSLAAQAAESKADVRRWRLARVCAVAAGLAILLDRLPVALACLIALAGILLVRPRGAPAAAARTARPARQRLRQFLVTEGNALCATAALALGIELWQDALTQGGAHTHGAEIGLYVTAFAAVGLVWSARAAGLRAGARPEPAARPPGPLLAIGLTLLLLFVVLAAAIHLGAVQHADLVVERSVYHHGGTWITRVMEWISAVGDPTGILWLASLVALGLVALGAAKRVGIYAWVLFGSWGLELLFKSLIQRARPPFARDEASYSYPSGHVLAATILAGAVLLLLLPRCRRPWQRLLLWSAAIGWPLLMAASRVYLGLHYVTDVGGALLLGAAWVCACQALVLALARTVRAAGHGTGPTAGGA
jgi:undecaprenyl-diphosphatase